ncbi:hypothetical protein CTAYLR_005948 [Chrysophaeum taylorii]|uniref:HMG box domain-containing protein n=1 Tax=Chrysophaeum taylorii TaxID=2483200 RepID=A0AAD7UCZ6_9STRA|nr:hypothetical protein CTAYLR_005948 [Chrysophaeum taylorii]
MSSSKGGSKKSSSVKDAQTGIEVKVPQPPRRLSSYQVYLKHEHASVAAALPTSSQQDIVGTVAAKWKGLDAVARDAWDRLTASENKKLMDEWEDKKHEREYERMTAARTMGLALSLSWEELVEAVKKRNGEKPVVSTTKPQASKRSLPKPVAFERAGRQNSNSTSPAAKGMQKRDIKQRSGDWNACWRNTARRKAVLKALDAIFSLAADRENFASFGNDIIQCFYDIACVTTDPVRGRALMYVEQLAQRWRHSILSRGWRTPGTTPTPQKIVDTITGLYCMERVGVSSARLKADVCEVVASLSPSPPQPVENDVPCEPLSAVGAPPPKRDAEDARYGPADYLGWDPLAGGPPEACEDVLSGEVTSKFRSMCNALIYTFYAERVGVDVGCGYADVLRWLDGMRPYKGPFDMDEWEDYVDQCYLVTHVVFTLNNWGELALEPELLPHEYSFVREHLSVAIRQRDVHLVGEYVECLRCFGATDADPLVQLGIAFLLGTQGSETDRWDEAEDAYTSYHATMVAAQALLAHNFRGFGPGLASALPVLASWLKTDDDLLQAVARAQKKNDDDDDNNLLASPDEVARAQARAKIAENATTKKKLPPSQDAKKRPPPLQEAVASKRTKTLEQQPPPPPLDLAGMESHLKMAANKADWATVTSILARLKDATIAVSDLTATTIGKTVAQLKKVDDDAVTAAAKFVVGKWKKLVKQHQG